MKIAERVYNKWFAPKKVSLKRGYAAAKISRTNKDWASVPYAANWTLYRDLRTLRARAREMCRNAPHFRKFLKMAERNVIGDKGIQLQCNATLGTANRPRPDTKLNSRVELAFWEWGFKENCSASGKLCFVEAQKLFIRHLVRDGEVLVQHLKSDNPFGYTLKFWNVDWLDETFNQELANGDRIIMSVEVDQHHRPLAYWLTTPASEINFTNRRERQRMRVPASEMTHAFLMDEDESQTRGVTWFHAALLQGKDLHEYTGGVVQQARVTAHSFGFLEKESPDETEFTGAEDDDGNETPVAIDVSPLSVNELPAGFKFTQFDPKQPTQNHAQFKQSMLLDIASALDVMGFSLSGDMSAVNYSSARVGLGEERDVWRNLQQIASDFCRDVYHRWLLSSMTTGKLQLTNREFDQLQNPNWRPRGWRYIDPQKEIGAAIDGIANNLLTYRSHFAEQGIDLEEFLSEKQAEMALFEQYGIEYGTAKPAAAAPAAQAEPDADDAGDAKPAKDNADRGYSNGKYHDTEILN